MKAIFTLLAAGFMFVWKALVFMFGMIAGIITILSIIKLIANVLIWVFTKIQGAVNRRQSC